MMGAHEKHRVAPRRGDSASAPGTRRSRQGWLRALILACLAAAALVACGDSADKEAENPESGQGGAAQAKAFESVEGRFSVAFPAEPERSEGGTAESLGRQMHQVNFFVKKDGVTYGVAYVDSPPELNLGIEGGVDAGLDAAAAALHPVSQDRVEAYGHPAIDLVVAEETGDRTRIRLVLVDRRMYQLFLGPDETGDMFARFAASFRLLA